MQATIQFLKDALRHEVKASAFYNKAAEVTRDDKSRMLYLELGGMEDDHASHLLDKINHTPYGKEFDADAFMRGLDNDLEAGISPAELQLIETGSLRQVLELAISLEHTKPAPTMKNWPARRPMPSSRHTARPPFWKNAAMCGN